MSVSLDALFETIVAPSSGDAAKPLYAVLPVPGYQSYFVGKDHASCACLLVITVDHSQRQPSPIRLESLDVQFELPCHLRKGDEPTKTGGSRLSVADLSTMKPSAIFCLYVTRSCT